MKSIGLIALDLDGTLLDSRKRLSPRNKEALIKSCQQLEGQWMVLWRRYVCFPV